MTLTLAAKKAVVEEVTAVATKAISAVVADYRGLTVNQMTLLRARARKSGVYLRVVPNTLTRRAFEKTEFACLSDFLVGPLFVALSLESPSDAACLLKFFLKHLKSLKLKRYQLVVKYMVQSNWIWLLAYQPGMKQFLS